MSSLYQQQAATRTAVLARHLSGDVRVEANHTSVGDSAGYKVRPLYSPVLPGVSRT